MQRYRSQLEQEVSVFSLVSELYNFEFCSMMFSVERILLCFGS